MTVIQVQRKILVEFCSNYSKDLNLQVAEKKGQITHQERSSLCFLRKLERTQFIFHAPSLRSNLHKPFITPTSPQICWCCQVGKIIQADNINDWTHHSGIILRERKGEKIGVRLFLNVWQSCQRSGNTKLHMQIFVWFFQYGSGSCARDLWPLHPNTEMVGTSQLHSMDVGNGVGLQHLGMLLRNSSLFPAWVTGHESLSQGFCACFWYLLTAHLLLSHPWINSLPSA